MNPLSFVATATSAILRAGAAIPLLLFAAPLAADWEVNLPRGVSEISRGVYDLHMVVLYICIAIGVLVYGLMCISILRHRKSRGVEPAKFTHSTVAEITWTVIPFFILVGMAIPAGKMLAKMEDTSGADLTISITGHQWKWEYEYPEQGIRFFSNLDEKSREARALDSGIDPYSVDNYLLDVDKPLVLPVDRKIRLVLTSGDVIHAWWVPEFAIKKDAIPGFIREMWTVIDTPGTYRGQCAELCGRDHGFMPIVVNAVSQGEFDAWVASEQVAARAESDSASREWAMAELMERGAAVYATNCQACHQANGLGIQGVFPSLDETTLSLQEHLNIVFNGVPGTAMQAFSQTLSDAEIAAIVTYERNSWGNNSGDVVQPAAVKAMR